MFSRLKTCRPPPILAGACPKAGAAFFFNPGESLGKDSVSNADCIMEIRQAFYLRVIPQWPLCLMVRSDRLLRLIPLFGAFGECLTPCVTANAYGAAVLALSESSTCVVSVSQYLETGEIWGINTEIAQRDSGNGWVVSLAMQNIILASLGLYLEFMEKKVNIGPPFLVEAGVAAFSGSNSLEAFARNQSSEAHSHIIRHRAVLTKFDRKLQTLFLLRFFDKILALQK